jgi:hypothetical protein
MKRQHTTEIDISFVRGLLHAAILTGSSLIGGVAVLDLLF